MDKSVLMHKILSGEASAQERAEFDDWISSDPMNAEDFDDMKLLYTDSGDYDPEERDEDFDAGLRKLQQTIRQLRKKEKRSRLFKVMTRSFILSAIIIFLAIGLSKTFGLHVGEKTEKLEVRLSDNLRFDGVTLESILKLLESEHELAYSVTNPALLYCKFTGTFYRGTTIREMVGIIAQAEDFQVSIDDDGRIQIEGAGCRP